MKTKFLLMITVLAALGASAQTETKTFTLRQSIDYALANNTSIKNATIDEYISKLKVDEYIGSGLPQINASGSVTHSDPLRRMFLGPNSLLTGGANPDVIAIPNVFQLKNSAEGGINFSQLLFSSSYFVGLKAAKTYQELAVLSKENSKVQVIENVSKAYSMALVNQERKNLFDVNIARVDTLLKQTRALNKSGFVEKIDVDRLEVTYNNLITERAKFDNMLILSNVLLKYQMGMPVGEQLELSDKLENLTLDQTISTSEKIEYSNRVEHKLLKTQYNLDKLNYKNNAYSFLPTLSFGGNLGVFTQSTAFDFHSKKHAWYPYGNYSLNLNMPIFSGFGRLKRTQQSKLSMSKSENNLKQFEQVVELQAKSSEINFKNSQQSLEVQKRNMELAKEVARVSQIKFTSGTGSNIEVINAESSLKESQINYYNALYDALVYKIEYDKALGNLK